MISMKTVLQDWAGFMKRFKLLEEKKKLEIR